MQGRGPEEFDIFFDVFLTYVIDIHHILTFQTSGDTWPVVFCLSFRWPAFKLLQNKRFCHACFFR